VLSYQQLHYEYLYICSLFNDDVNNANYTFIHQWLYSPLLGPGVFFSVAIIFTQTVGLLGRGISPSQGRYLHTEQHKHRINAYTDIHALTEIRKQAKTVHALDRASAVIGSQTIQDKIVEQ
jgi:hypothetical protein